MRERNKDGWLWWSSIWDVPDYAPAAIGAVVGIIALLIAYFAGAFSVD